MKTLIAACLLVLLALPAGAGRPLATEDASILDAKACQLEMWFDRSSVATDLWFVPACNFGADLELQVGGARTFQSGSGAFSQGYFQAKTVFRSIDEHPWGVGLAAGVVRRDAQADWSDPYVIVPLSFKAGENLVHLNAGWVRNRAENRNLTLWGVAFEAPVGDKLTLLAETYGENSRNPFFRAGGRYSAVKDRLDFDLTFVTRSGGTSADRFVSIGLYYKTDAFLP